MTAYHVHLVWAETQEGEPVEVTVIEGKTSTTSAAQEWWRRYGEETAGWRCVRAIRIELCHADGDPARPMLGRKDVWTPFEKLASPFSDE